LRLDEDWVQAGGFGEEVSYGGCYLLGVDFQGEVSSIQKLDGGVGVIARVGLCAGKNEERVVPAPDCERRRLRSIRAASKYSPQERLR